MIFKSILLIAAIALVNAEEEATCSVPAVRYNTTGIIDASNFCTMLPAKGIQDVATYEACALSYCLGSDFAAKASDKTYFPNGVLPMPTGFIKSAHFVEDTANDYVQITGCMDSSVLDLSPTDEGGQMDSHGWQYKCYGYKKFVSLLEPSTNTYCIRCCNGPNYETDCDTSHSTDGCTTIIPGSLTMSDGVTSCPLPNGSAVSSPSSSAVVSSAVATSTVAPTISATASVTVSTTVSATVSATISAAISAATTAGSSTSSTTTSAGARLSMSLEFVGLVAAAAMGISAAF